MPCGATQRGRAPTRVIARVSHACSDANIADVAPPADATSIARFMSKCVTSARPRSGVSTTSPGFSSTSTSASTASRGSVRRASLPRASPLPCEACGSFLSAASGGGGKASATKRCPPGASIARWCGASRALGSTSTGTFTTASPSRSITLIASDPLSVTYIACAIGMGTSAPGVVVALFFLHAPAHASTETR